MIVKTMEETPQDATHWSTRSMAKATGMSQSAISRIWRVFALKPHPVDDFKLSPDPLFIDKVRDIVGLYLNPPDAAVVLCENEKTQVQALDRTSPMLPLLPGVPERRTHDYKRNGITNLYAALDVASGNVIADLTPRHRAEEFRRFLNLIDKSVPAHLDVHVILDNQSTHKTPSIQRCWCAIPGSRCTSRRPIRAGSTSWNAGSPSSPPNGYVEALITRSKRWSRRSAPGSGTGMTNPSPSSGTRPPTRSWPALQRIVSESLTQDTRGSEKGPVNSTH